MTSSASTTRGPGRDAMSGSKGTIRPLVTALMVSQPGRAATDSGSTPGTRWSASRMTSGSAVMTSSGLSCGYCVSLPAAMFAPPARVMMSSMNVPGPAVKSVGSSS